MLQIAVPDAERQWSYDRDLLLWHPAEQTDAFALRVKSTILLSRVKNFNSRFRACLYAGAPALAGAHRVARVKAADPRATAAFAELDRTIAGFAAAFPPHLQRPVDGQTVDTHLFTACSAQHQSVPSRERPRAALTSVLFSRTER